MALVDIVVDWLEIKTYQTGFCLLKFGGVDGEWVCQKRYVRKTVMEWVKIVRLLMAFRKSVCGTRDTIEGNTFELKLSAAFKWTFMVVYFFFRRVYLVSLLQDSCNPLPPIEKMCFVVVLVTCCVLKILVFFWSSQMSLGWFINYCNTSICSFIVCPVHEKTNSWMFQRIVDRLKKEFRWLDPIKL